MKKNIVVFGYQLKLTKDQFYELVRQSVFSVIAIDKNFEKDDYFFGLPILTENKKSVDFNDLDFANLEKDMAKLLNSAKVKFNNIKFIYIKD
jgi:hypothetical protein